MSLVKWRCKSLGERRRDIAIVAAATGAASGVKKRRLLKSGRHHRAGMRRLICQRWASGRMAARAGGAKWRLETGGRRRANMHQRRKWRGINSGEARWHLGRTG